jgi:hypothetical protein
MRSLRKPYKSYKTKNKSNSKSNAFLHPFSSNKNGSKYQMDVWLKAKGKDSNIVVASLFPEKAVVT